MDAEISWVEKATGAGGGWGMESGAGNLQIRCPPTMVKSIKTQTIGKISRQESGLSGLGAGRAGRGHVPPSFWATG